MAEETNPPPDSKLTRTKQRWAREDKFLTGRSARPSEQRLPPGQHLTRDWPALGVTWSRYDNQWEGLGTRELLTACQPKDDARFVVLHSYDGYTTNLALDDFAAEDALLAHSWSGKPLDVEHGGPVRLVVPHLYFWKSAKWLQAIEFLTEDKPGYWEVRGYHNRGDPWLEQRYSSD